MAVGSTAARKKSVAWAVTEQALAELLDAPVPATDHQYWVTFLAHVGNSRDAALCKLGAEIAASRSYEFERMLTAEAYVATAAGCSVSHARRLIAIGQRLSDYPQLRNVFNQGLISFEEVALIIEGSDLDPSAHDDLIDTAKNDTLAALQDKVREIKMAQLSPKSVEEAERASYFKTRRSRDGFGHHVSGYWTNEDVARLGAVLEPETNRRAKRMLKDQTFVSRNHCRAKALVDLAISTGGKARQTTHISIAVDIEALKRGRANYGELARIPGVGPVTVDRIKKLLDGAYLDVIVRTTDYESPGYRPSAQVMRALDLESDRCEIYGCDAIELLEADHNHERRDGGKTTRSNMGKVCYEHHAIKSYYRVKLVGRRGRRRMVALTPAEMFGARAGPQRRGP